MFFRNNNQDDKFDLNKFLKDKKIRLLILAGFLIYCALGGGRNALIEKPAPNKSRLIRLADVKYNFTEAEKFLADLKTNGHKYKRREIRNNTDTSAFFFRSAAAGLDKIYNRENPAHKKTAAEINWLFIELNRAKLWYDFTIILYTPFRYTIKNGPMARYAENTKITQSHLAKVENFLKKYRKINDCAKKTRFLDWTEGALSLIYKNNIIKLSRNEPLTKRIIKEH